MPSKKLARKIEPQPRPQSQDEEMTQPWTEDEDGPDLNDVVKAAVENGDDPDDDIAPAFKIRGGRTEATRQQEATSSYAKTYKASSNATDVVKFLEDSTYACYRQHWVPYTTAEGRQTKRPVVCYATGGKECEICETGDRPNGVYAFNIAVIGDDGQILHRTWNMGIKVYKQAEGYMTDPKFAPLTRNYYTVKKFGEGTNTSYTLTPIRASALVEDLDIPVPDEAEFERLKHDLYTAADVQIETPKTMREIAREVAAEY